MKHRRKLNLRKINIAKISTSSQLKGGITGNTGGPLDTVIQCPLSLDVNDECYTTDGLGTRYQPNCNTPI